MSFLSKLLGSNVKPAQINYSTPGFNGGGLVGNFDAATNSYNINPDYRRVGAVDNIASNFGELGDRLGGFADKVAPGYNDLLKARLNSINDSASAAIGDLRQNLQARRVLGSSFGQDTLTRADAEFSRQRDEATADSFMKSLQASVGLVSQQYDAYSKQFQTGLDELNLEGQLAASLQSSTAQILAQNAQTQAKINESAAEKNASTNLAISQGVGKFLTGGGFKMPNILPGMPGGSLTG